LLCAVDRYYWDAWDPVHVCEGLFAVGNILNFTRMFHLLAINEFLGPMLISLERMIKVSRKLTRSCRSRSPCLFIYTSDEMASQNLYGHDAFAILWV